MSIKMPKLLDRTSWEEREKDSKQRAVAFIEGHQSTPKVISSTEQKGVRLPKREEFVPPAK